MSVSDYAILGRLHPLVLHLPIGFLFGALVLEVLAARGRVTRPGLRLFLWLAALSAALAAGTGWVLGQESGYASEVLARHQRLGIAVAIAALFTALLHDARGRSSVRLGLYRAALVAACVLLVPAGHLGSTLTHGADWLAGPVPRGATETESSQGAERELGAERQEAALVQTAESGTRTAKSAVAPVSSAEPAKAGYADETYATAIAPFFKTYCTTCHGPLKHKGHLRLDSGAALLAGGESGPALVPGDPAASLLFERVSRPLDHEDHMPPEGKPQPSAQELAALKAWIAAGAPGSAGAPAASDAPLNDPHTSGDAGRPSGAKAPDELPAPAEARAALADAFVHAEALEPGSDLLRVDVAARAPTFGDAELEALLVPLGAWIGELSLARSAISDAALAQVARFPRLRRLDLRATRVTAAGLAALRDHETLAELNLAQTQLGDSAVDVLLDLPQLRRLWLWKAGLTESALARLRAIPALTVLTGDEPEAEALESEGELAFTSDRPLPGAEQVPEALRPVNANCPVSGSPVNPKYSVVYEGRVVGFCCPNCPKDFWTDPAKYAAKLP